MTREYNNLSLIHCLIASNVKEGNSYFCVNNPDLTFIKDIYVYFEDRRFKHSIPSNISLLYNMFLSHPKKFLISSSVESEIVNITLLFHIGEKSYKFIFEYKGEYLSIIKHLSYRQFDKGETKYVCGLLVKGLMNFFEDKV